MHKHQLQLPLFVVGLLRGHSRSIGDGSRFSKRLGDGLLHGLYRCGRSYELSQPKSKVLKELLRRCHLKQSVDYQRVLQCEGWFEYTVIRTQTVEAWKPACSPTLGSSAALYPVIC